MNIIELLKNRKSQDTPRPSSQHKSSPSSPRRTKAKYNKDRRQRAREKKLKKQRERKGIFALRNKELLRARRFCDFERQSRERVKSRHV